MIEPIDYPNMNGAIRNVVIDKINEIIEYLNKKEKEEK